MTVLTTHKMDVVSAKWVKEGGVHGGNIEPAIGNGGVAAHARLAGIIGVYVVARPAG